MTNFPPLKLEDASQFSKAYSYKEFTICVYCKFIKGRRNLEWYYIIYDANGDRRHFNQMPDDNWIYEEVAEYCKANVIDKWKAPRELVELAEF